MVTATTELDIVSEAAKQHYDRTYFDWQCSIGEFGGWANLTKFEQYIRPSDNVLDFGCGGGYLLRNLTCRGKLGLDVNESAAKQAAEIGVKVTLNFDDVQDEWADVIISDNALEHTGLPLNELCRLHPKLKPGGRIVFVVPCENISYKYKPNDVNYHLYSWGPMSLGNLFTEAGYEVQESKPYIHKWPRKYRKVARWGRRYFEFRCRIRGMLERSWFQVRVVATKPR